MADAFGTFASAVQVADLAKKIKDFCDDVKDAPTVIRHLTKQVHHLSVQCAEIADQARLQPGAFSRTESLTFCLGLCEFGVASLRPVFSHLEALMSKHRRLGSIKAALQKDTLDGYRDRLQETCTSLTLAHAIFTEYGLWQLCAIAIEQ